MRSMRSTKSRVQSRKRGPVVSGLRPLLSFTCSPALARRDPQVDTWGLKIARADAQWASIIGATGVFVRFWEGQIGKNNRKDESSLHYLRWRANRIFPKC